MKTVKVLAALAAIVAMPAIAADGWAGSAELGFSNTTGNSKDRTLNARLDIDYAQDRWRHNFFGDVYYAEADSNKTAERYVLGYKPSYFLTDRDYVFGTVRYDRDKFADIKHRWTEVIGYGRQLINTPDAYLEAEIGAGARQTDYVLNPNNLDTSEAILYTGGRFTYRISDSARFLQTLRIEWGKDNTYTESVTGVQLRVTNAVSAKVTHTIRHNSDIVGVRGKKTDQITGVNLVYSF